MKFGGSTFSYMWTATSLDAMRELRQIGLNDFDIIAVPGHLWPDELDAAQRRALRQSLEHADIRVESLNLPSVDQNLASCIPEARAYAVDVYTRTLRLAADLGARNVVVVPGRVGALLPPQLAHSLGWLEQGFSQLLRVAEESDQRLSLERIPLAPIATVDRLMPFLDRFGNHPRLLVAYDVASAEFMGEDQLDALARIGPRLGQTHLSDSTRTTWRHDRVGLGSVDFASILDALREARFDGVNVLEIISTSPRGDIADSLRALDALQRGRLPA
jgi:sugar phosphate isomerase/epimerase